jgi:tRNA(Arg) A34 adenosine deaminase TadA
MPANHEHFMRMAIEEAAKGGAEGNSAVGSVIVREMWFNP